MISYNHSREDSYLLVYYLHEHSAPWLQNWLGTNRTTYYTINIFLVALHALFIFWISVSRFYNSANTVKRRSLKNIVFVVWWSICSRKTFIVWWASISWFLKMRGPVNSWKLIFLPVELDFFYSISLFLVGVAQTVFSTTLVAVALQLPNSWTKLRIHNDNKTIF